MAREWMDIVAAAAFSVTILSAGQAATHAPRVTWNAPESANIVSWQDAFLRGLLRRGGA